MDYIIIVAGGKGLRMGSDTPKQFLPIGGKPVLMRTIERFREYSPELTIILVLPQAQQDYWATLCREYRFSVDYLLAPSLPLTSSATALRRPARRRPSFPWCPWWRRSGNSPTGSWRQRANRQQERAAR